MRHAADIDGEGGRFADGGSGGAVEGSDAWKVVGANGAHRASPVSASMTDVLDDVSADPVGSQESVVVDEQQTDMGAV